LEALAELGQVFETVGIRDPKTNKFHKLTKKNIEKARELYLEAAE